MLQRCRPTDRGDLDQTATRLALAAGQGDRAALAEFIALTQADVWRYLAHLAGTDQADDLVQDTYLRAMDSLPRFEARCPARAWLLTIARRVAADRIRHDRARPQSPRPTESLTLLPDAADDCARVEAAAMLARLSDERREAFVLTQLMGFGYREAAEVCGVPIGTIRSRVARARAQLVAEWQAVDQPSDPRISVGAGS